MVKHILLLFSILFPVFGFSQDTRLFQNDWQLTRLTTDNNNYYNPKRTDGVPVMLWFYEDSHRDMFSTWVCDTKQGEINFDVTNPEFTIFNTGTTLGGCGLFYDPNKIEMVYFNFYSDGSVLSYFIENTSDGLTLTITKPNGDEAIYSEPKPLERIGSGSWQLTDLWINSEQVTNLVDNNGNPINTVFNFDASQQIDFFNFSVCENIEGQINYLSDIATAFSVTNTTTTFGSCIIDPPLNPDDIYDIDGKLFDFYNQNDTYFYVIVEEGLNTPKKLTIAAPNFDYAIYSQASLSTRNLTKKRFSIYPNPVKNELSIASEDTLKNIEIQIHDILGKIKISKTLKSSDTVNVESLSKGVYFLLIKDELGNTATKKFIKI
jgi:hypothetical protein